MKRRSEVSVGVVIILGLVLIVGGTIWLRGHGLGGGQRQVQARFREVGQLQTGNSVKLRGVPVGRVEEISLEQRGVGVIVKMSIDENVQLPDDPVVILSPESLFGDWQAEIFPRTRFPLYNYAESSDPAVLPGYSLPDVSRMTAVAERIAENIAVITDRVDIAFTEQTALNIRQAVENIQSVTGQLTGLLKAQERTVQGVADQLEATSRTLSSAAETAQRTFAQVESAISQGELASIVDNIDHVTAEMERLSGNLVDVSGQLGSAVASADTTFRSLQVVTNRIQNGQGTLGMLLQDTTLYGNLVLTNKLVQDLLLDFQRNPRKYINLNIF
ncbi:MAG TPA: MlaD family protein [Longimicrobiales bacterium]|nr:MlaD family protein [Longimicrobiales bacterium]